MDRSDAGWRATLGYLPPLLRAVGPFLWIHRFDRCRALSHRRDIPACAAPEGCVPVECYILPPYAVIPCTRIHPSLDGLGEHPRGRSLVCSHEQLMLAA
jgi:hypothetical protein